MTIFAMTVTKIDRHPDADALRVVGLSCPNVEHLTVVANMEQPYNIDDIVAVARIGAVLEDGTQIRKVRLRGIDSFGMILGRVDATVGANVTEQFGGRAPAPAEPEAPDRPPDTPAGIPPGVQVVRWTSIEGLPHVRRSVAAQTKLDPDAIVQPTLTYRAKVKLDGTNAAVHICEHGQFAAQSRTRLLTPDSDNYGFAAWVHDSAEYFGGLFDRLGHATVYGEWCGPGIQKRVAITAIDRKIFAVFAIQLGDPSLETARIVVEPEQLASMLPTHPDIRVLPWHGEPVVLDFHDEAGLEPGVAQINALVAEVESVDPWVRDEFGVHGIGEGVVLYPVSPIEFDERQSADRDTYTALMFKAKGEAHRVKRQATAVQVDPQVAANIAMFIDQFVTPARLEQGLVEACAGELDMRRMGDFLRWLGRDVQKECTLELEASQLEWKKVAKAVGQAGQRWYRRKVTQS